jgi:hypothetical protein
MLPVRWFIAVPFVLLAVAASSPARSADFRVENKVFIEGEAKPQSQGTTIFCSGMVYDFLADPAEIMVFDKPHGRFVLLDLGRRVQSEVSIEDVKAFIDRAKKNLAHSNTPPQIHWLAEPAFDTTYDAASSLLTLRSEWLTYEVVLLPTGPDVAAQYREFSDCDAQFNHVLNPRSRPPFPRMMLDAELERNHGIAKEVRLTTKFFTPTPTKITSRHELAGQLDESDTKRIAEAREDIKSFQHVALKDYVQRK